jgi:hypothetical protein
MYRKLPTLALAAAAASQLGATDCGQIIRDPGFDLWCGDQLCSWKVERGSVERVPTWNEGDPGVALLGSDTAIEQLTPVTDADTTCIEITMMSNVTLDAHVVLNIDVDDDGTIEQSEQLPTAAWQPLTFLVAIRAPYSGVRFELAKTGPGSAELADINAVVSTACGAGQTPLDPRPVPIGEPCQGSADCRSGFCALPVGLLGLPGAENGNGVCASCDATSCGSGEVCGAGIAPTVVAGVAPACVPAGSKPLGELCLGDAECAAGPCVNDACSECNPVGSNSCPNGETCLSTWPEFFDVFTPFLCSPSVPRGSGEVCVDSDECSSGVCVGETYSECSDSRPCTSDQDCPIDGDTLLNGACQVVGVVGGTCE